MNISNVEAFLAIVHSKSVSKAANSLFLTQSTVSNRLNSLEDEIGLKLFERRQGIRGVQLTPKGEELIPIAERWLELWAETQQLKQSKPLVDLIIGSPDSLNICVLIPFFQYLANDPTVNLDVRTHQSDEVYALLERRSIDIGFSFRYMQYHSVSVEKIFDDPLCVVCRPGNKFYPDAKIHPSQLDVKNELRLGWSPEFKQWHEKWWSASEKPRAFLDTPSLIFGLMDKPDYWAICSKSVSIWMCTQDNIEVHQLSVPAPLRTCYFLQHVDPPVQKREILLQTKSYFKNYCENLGFSLLSD